MVPLSIIHVEHLQKDSNAQFANEYYVLRFWPGQMRCSNMAADSKTKKKLGHNLTIIRAVLLPKTRFRTTTGRYIVKYVHFGIVVYVFR